jgi:hypothetical protein
LKRTYVKGLVDKPLVFLLFRTLLTLHKLLNSASFVISCRSPVVETTLEKGSSVSMAGFDYNGLACFDTWLHVANGFGFNNWLRLQWLGFDVWVRAVKWLRLQWLTAASMP